MGIALKGAAGLPASASRPATIRLVSHSSALRGALERRLSTAAAASGLSGREAGSGPRAVFQDGEGAAAGPPPHILVLDAEVAGRQTADIARHAIARWPGTLIVVLASERQIFNGTNRLPPEAVTLRHSGNSTVSMRKAADDIVGLIPLVGTPAVPATRRPRGSARFAALVVASSTGGPDALRAVFAALCPADVAVPVFVVQHMPPSFTPMLAAQLSENGWNALEGVHNAEPAAGSIHIAPGGRHMAIAGAAAALRIRLTDDGPINYCRPSADVLFASAAAVLGPAVLALVLTGMGSDGAEGAKIVTAVGGTVLAQDRATSVVWGMPGATVQGGAAHRVLPLGDVAGAVRAALTTGRP